jgi:glutathione reductase (NADPH)
MTQTDYDLFVIGGGSGGVRAARVAASHGAKVAIAEEYRLGGTCVIRGCVPKKLLVYASRFGDDFEDAAGYGWTLGAEPKFEWATLIANKDREIDRLERAYESNLNLRGVTIMRARAVLDGPNGVRLNDGSRVTARVILIATGGHPVIDPDLKGAEHVITSNEAFHLDRLPRRVVVVGGGYIAVEFASIFAGLGAETILLHRGEKVLRGFDEDLRDDLMLALEHRGVRLMMLDHLTHVEKSGDTVFATTNEGKSIEANTIMAATGRRPSTAGLGLESAGVKCGHHGEIIVDAYSETTAPGVYAVGDVTNRINLTPVAIREGHAFADTVFGGKLVSVDHTLVPTSVFTTPEIGTVGLSEAAAREHYSEIDIYKARFRPMRNTLAGRDERMLMKLVVDAETDRVLGCHVLGPDATEIVQMAAIAMRMGAKKADFDATMALHPSAAEELVTMREKWVPPQERL